MSAYYPRAFLAFALLTLGGLVACAPVQTETPVAQVDTAEKPAPPPYVPSAASQAARAHYAAVQADLLSRGLLRTDGGVTDAPFTDRMLADNFVRIALYDEYSRGTSGGLIAQPAQSTLRRWDQPVRVALRFGASVSPERQATDRARVGSFLARLQQISGHSIRLSDTQPNFFIYIVDEDERRALGPAIKAALPGLSAIDTAGITDMPRSTYCLVYAMSGTGKGGYTRAMAVIRAEHPDLMMLSCIHEEVTQGLGLANDSPVARPSIFNDDEEFALLTPMDELMLKMLYNPALRTGITESEARPIVDQLAAGLVGGSI
ncbi:MAG: hypothetical protein DI533_05470 [Cereibacter sphaeroides]|uniref:DUF2927 domain-containing protein n=1 Tax=Cereibacter sphaeroides TaxID=1063 RepID=A0A2W5UQJ3_CERSP|nr:MAG: hypothetical protein DI533_05470 [Cereibacter sphaeroides]